MSYIEDIIIYNQSNVFFFSKDGCHYCLLLEKDLNTLNIPYTKCQLDSSDPDYEAHVSYLKQQTGMKTFPMLYFGSKLIGGYTDFQKLGMTGRLAEELAPLGIKFEEDF